MSLAIRFAALEECILRLEQAFEAGQLSEIIAAAPVDEVLRPIYAGLASRGAPLPFRLRAVRAVLSGARRLARPPRIAFNARADMGVVAAPNEEPRKTLLRLSVEAPGGPRSMSLPRVLAARFWGIEIRPTEHDARVLCEDWVWGSLVSGVRSNLAAIGKIEAQFASRGTVDPEVTIVPDQESEAFERLMLDILGEGGLQARQAPLLEDFFEKTDLRVHVPGLARKRGARVQVTQSIDVERLRAKTDRIRDLDEFVVLSPRALAESLHRSPRENDSPGGELRTAVSALGLFEDSTEGAARGLRSLFLSSIRHPGDDVRGPVATIPAPVISLVCRFVESEALRSTAAMRAHELDRKND